MILACSPDKPQAAADARSAHPPRSAAPTAGRRTTTKSSAGEVRRCRGRRRAKVGSGHALAMQAVLCSPKFLFRVELDDRPDAAEARTRSTSFNSPRGCQYFLWSSMPDDELFDLAAKGQADGEPRRRRSRRMLQDPKAASAGRQLRDAVAATAAAQDARARSRSCFPTFNEQLRQAMLEETRAVLRRDRPRRPQHPRPDRRRLHVPQRAAGQALRHRRHERQPRRPARPSSRAASRSAATSFVRVTLPTDERGGLLTQASILTVTSNPTRTSPVKRGNWVLEQILGTPPPPPPPNVPELDGKTRQLTGTLRQRMEQHRAEPGLRELPRPDGPARLRLRELTTPSAPSATKDGEFADRRRGHAARRQNRSRARPS